MCQSIGFIRDGECFLKIHQLFSQLGSSAKTLGIPTTGPAVRNHISSKMAERSIAKRRTPYLVYRQALQAHLHPHLQHFHRRKPYLMEHPASTRSENMSEEVLGNSSHGLPEWQEEFEDNPVDESVPEHRDASISWITFRAASKSGVGYAQHFFLTSRRTTIEISASEPKLPCLLAEDALVRSCPERKFLVVQ